jgi:hypothetical protein
MAISKLKVEIINLCKDITAQSAITSTHRIASYAQAAARAPPPGHALSHGTSTPGISPMELRKDREVIIKLGSKEVI